MRALAGVCLGARPSLLTLLLATGFGNWIYTYCVHQAGLSEAAGQQITSLYWLAFTLGRLPAVSCTHTVVEGSSDYIREVTEKVMRCTCCASDCDVLVL